MAAEKIPMIHTWYGERVDELPREKLIEAVAELAVELREVRAMHAGIPKSLTKGYTAAIDAIERWRNGFYSEDTRDWLGRVVDDLRRNAGVILTVAEIELRRDSDGSGEAGETAQTGSTEGERGDAA